MANQIAQTPYKARAQDCRQRQEQSNAVQERLDPCHCV